MTEPFLNKELTTLNAPKKMEQTDESLVIHTEPGTDLWQRTYYGFQNDNAPMVQTQTDEPSFSFVTKVENESSHRFDQAGIVVYLDSDNWIKASSEYENEDYQRLGSVVTNGGYSDWASQDIDAAITTVWYRLSRRGPDFRVEYSLDGTNFKQIRICHMDKGDAPVSFGVYACSPENGSFKATFSEMTIGPGVWEAHE
ncbi:hypothetical protein SAMN04488100_10750 [Alkalibacterium putridalgicola]|uniref:DUF1349 domain-containing protein n=1 Tax=Alkalibacterium putridalgicola TaxID=426703 RepID=A0A1H7S849_9LACT|nr:DUF1349 domain-containing protein [Alkalibacterium putridalgicola]GEK89100.1 hypothetical protein APU01nite_11390 [Alkalibacterium putridalgicola]SEL68800.1 hypothetical protein SAMN04488100_10750 [Alkalibacterium putridalgicola]